MQVEEKFKPTMRIKFTCRISVFSTKGVNYETALLTLLQMEQSANVLGDPRVHITEVTEDKGGDV